MRPKHLLICLLFLSLSCNHSKRGKNYSFYHWNTIYKSTEKTDKLITEGATYKEYVRFFDLVVDKNADKVFPVATVQFEKDTKVLAKEVIPVIYIRNEVFLHKDGNDFKLYELAQNTAAKIQRLQNKYLINKADVKEIQIDCDWTQSTKSNFFEFLRTIKQTMPNYSLTATLRLHQVKYKNKTGVPPVDKVVLMAYNVGDLGDVNETNSIISNEITEQYLQTLKEYPLPYDVALPLFEWGVLYRSGKLKGLVRELTPSLLESAFVKKSKKNVYTAKSDSYVNGVFIYKGDELRVETVTANKLDELADLIKDASASNTNYQTIYYHINSPLTTKFSSNELSSFAK